MNTVDRFARESDGLPIQHGLHLGDASEGMALGGLSLVAALDRATNDVDGGVVQLRQVAARSTALAPPRNDARTR